MKCKDVHSFLSLTGYFQIYTASCAAIAKPLSDLLRDSIPFKFGPEQNAAFQQLKDILAKEPVLHLYKHGSHVSEQSCCNRTKMKNFTPSIIGAKRHQYSKKNFAVMNWNF